MAEDFTTRTPGQMLRAARQEQEHSLQDAHEGTKIPVQLLEAIERDEYHKLSGPLYVKSFLRNYAGWLGLDPEEILSVYELATGRPEPTPSAAEEVWSEDQVAVTRVGLPWGRLVAMGVGVVVVLIVLIVLAMRLFGGGEEASPEASAAGGAVPEQRTVVTEAARESEVAAPARETEARPSAERDPEPPRQDDAASPAVAGTADDGTDDDATAGATGAPDDAGPDEEAGGSAEIGHRVQAKVQPDRRDETREQRLARLDRYRLGGQPEQIDAPAATGDEPRESPPAPQLPAPRRGDPELRFRGGETFPLVLRVLMPEAANCTVRRDDQADAVPVIWPDEPSPPPAYNLRHGLAYAVRGGYAIYWGAEDHFTLTLERVDGVEVTLNGHPQALRDWRPGQTKLLDRSILPGGG